MDRQYIYPWENMYPELPLPYLQPYQSNYHNLGLNGYFPGRLGGYPGKRYGSQGDYGPRQSGCYEPNDTYPLDALVMMEQGINPYGKSCGFIRNATTPRWSQNTYG